MSVPTAAAALVYELRRSAKICATRSGRSQIYDGAKEIQRLVIGRALSR